MEKVIFEQCQEGYSCHYEDCPDTVGQGTSKLQAFESLEATSGYVKDLEATDGMAVSDGLTNPPHAPQEEGYVAEGRVVLGDEDLE